MQIIPSIFLILVAIVSLVIFIVTNNKKSQLYEKVAQTLGLSYSKSQFLGSSLIEGNIKKYSFEAYEVGKNKDICLKIKLKFDLEGPSGWSISKENFFTKMQRSMGIQDIQIGDEEFDREFLLEGRQPMFIHSLLNHEVRQKLFLLHRYTQTLLINKEGIEILLQQKEFDVASRLISIINEVRRLADLLSAEKSIPKRLINNVLNDTHSAVRVINLKLLHTFYPDSPETLSVLETAMQSDSQDLQVAAAILLKDKGLPFLTDLLSSPDIEVPNALEILSHFKSIKYKDSASLLLEFYRKSEDNRVKIAVIHALQAFGNSSVEDFLLHQLSENKDKQLEDSLIKALGSCGTIKAVEHLFKLVKAGVNPAKKNLIQDSVAKIQERSGMKGDKGWLSLSGSTDAEGGLSLPGGDEGGLSMSEEE